MKNYMFVAAMTLVIAMFIFVYKSCSVDVPNIGPLGTLIPNNATIKPKPTTHVNTTTTTVVKPDGSTTTTIVDKTVINAPRRLRIDAGMSTPWLQPKGPKTYDIGLHYRILDHVWLGGTVDSDKNIGVRVGVEL
jgi:hypothetical protein